MRRIQLTLFFLLIGASSVAQNVMLAEAGPLVESAASSISPKSLPSAPQPQKKVADKKFIAVMATLGAAETLRITTNTLALDHMFTEGTPWVTSAPNNRNVVATNGLIFASEFIVAYELKKSHDWLPGDRVIRKLWWVYPAAMTVLSFRKAAHTIGMSAPAGCTSIECQLP